MVKKWKTKKETYKEALNYINDRRVGKVKSLKVGSPRLNDAMCDGFEWHTCTLFAARPGVGKSLLKQQIINEAFQYNPDVRFRVLDFDLEMPTRITAIREFSSHLGKSYKYLCSAEINEQGSHISRKDIEKCFNYAKQRLEVDGEDLKYPVDTIDDAPTVEEFEKIVEEYMAEYAEYIDGKIIWSNLLLTVDHARLFRKNGRQEKDMLYELAETIIRLKKKYPIAFIILNHLGRDIMDASRCEPGKYANYPVDNDIFGADAFQQAADVVVAIDRPAKREIKYYGPYMHIIEDSSVLVFHFLKVRNGDGRMSFFRADYERMQIIETEPPPTATKREIKS